MVNLEMRRPFLRMGGLGMSVEAMPMRSGDAGVEQTIRAMRRLIEQGKKDPVVHELAATILRSSSVPAFNWSGEVRAIYNWVLQNIRFTRDVYGKETLHSAREIIRLGIGDCDDFTILLCALLGTIGHKTRILTIAKPEDERNFSHVFPQVFVDGRWLTIDAARRGAAIGRNPENCERVRIWNTTSDDFVDVEGLSGSAGTNPNALPGAYPASVADPRFRNLRGHSIRGIGHYGAAAVHRALSGRGTSKSKHATMGQIDPGQIFIDPTIGDGGGVNWGAITAAIQAGTTGAANIISATRASPYNLFPTTSPIGTTRPFVSASVPGFASGSIAGISTGTLLLGGLGFLAVALLAGERGRR